MTLSEQIKSPTQILFAHPSITWRTAQQPHRQKTEEFPCSLFHDQIVRPCCIVSGFQCFPGCLKEPPSLMMRATLQHSESLLKHVPQTDFVQHSPSTVGECLGGDPSWSLLSRNCHWRWRWQLFTRHHSQPTLHCLQQENSGIRHRCDGQHSLLCAATEMTSPSWLGESLPPGLLRQSLLRMDSPRPHCAREP